MHAREAFDLTKQTVMRWLDDGASSMGAAIAFYALFSMAPLLLLVIAVAGLVIDPAVAREALSGQVTDLIGPQGAAAVLALLEASDERTDGIIAAAVSVGTLLLGATTVFGELRRDLDIVWRYEAPAAGGVRQMIGARMWSFGLVLTIGFLLLVSLGLSTAVSVVGGLLADRVPAAGVLLRVLEFFVSFVVITGLFAMIYKMLPSARIAWADVWVGAAITSLLFWVGKWAIGLYLGKSAVASPFGAAGTIVVVIVWVYYSSQIFLLGAQFTRTYALWRAARLAPREPSLPPASA